MKLLHHAGVVKQDRHEHPKRSPFSSFKLPVGSLALLSAFAFAPMVFPRPAAAQDWSSKPDWSVQDTFGWTPPAAPLAAAAASDSAKPASVPSADTGKQATGASDSALPPLKWLIYDKPVPPAPKDTTPPAVPTTSAAEDTASSSAPAIENVPEKMRAVVLRPFLSFGSILAHDPSVITGIESVPLAVRDVPVPPEDLARGGGVSWAKPIGNLGGDFHIQSGGLLDLFTGLDLSFHNGLAALVFGAGYSLRLDGDSSIFNERNYGSRSADNGIFTPDTGSPTGYKKNSGYAYSSLTYYSILYDGGSFYFFAEAKAAASRRLSFGLGCKVYWEKVSASNGWDKEKGYFEWGDPPQEWKSFDIASLAVRMPYAFADLQLTPPDDSFVKGTLRAYFGAKYASYSFIMPGTELVLRKTPVYSAGLKLELEAIKHL